MCLQEDLANSVLFFWWKNGILERMNKVYGRDMIQNALIILDSLELQEILNHRRLRYLK